MQHKEVNPPLVIRADAGPHIGMGHLMRCLALAEAWHERGGRIILACAAFPPQIEGRLRGLEIELTQIKSAPGSREDAVELCQCARLHPAAPVVIDGYHFDQHYQRELKQADLRVLAFDDYGHAGHYWADWVLNQNLSATPDLYKNRENYTQLLLGPKFVQLRREFLPWQEWRRDIPAVARKILVTLGGSDPDNFTEKAVVALTQMEEDLEVVVLLGASHVHRAALELKASQKGGRIRMEYNSPDVARWMAWADVAVAASGTTSWELAFMGLPSAIVCLAENQREIARSLSQTGISELAGWHADVTPADVTDALLKLLTDQTRRQNMSQRGRNLVDGAGGSRVVSALRS